MGWAGLINGPLLASPTSSWELPCTRPMNEFRMNPACSPKEDSLVCATKSMVHLTKPRLGFGKVSLQCFAWDWVCLNDRVRQESDISPYLHIVTCLISLMNHYHHQQQNRIMCSSVYDDAFVGEHACGFSCSRLSALLTRTAPQF